MKKILSINGFSLQTAGIALSGFFICGAGVTGAAASGYEFDGIGARAIARGGALIADAGDWTGIYWNPAGLAATGEKQAGLELRAGRQYTKDGNSFNVPGTDFDKTRAAAGFVIGSMGTVIPLNEKSALGAGVYTPLLQGSDFKDTNPANLIATSLDYKGGVVTGVANVSYSRKLTDNLSGGLGVNAMYASLSSDSEIIWGAAMVPLNGMTQKNKSDAAGIGMEGTAGLTYRINDAWTAGAVARSGAKIVLHGEEKVYLNGAFQQKSDFTMPVHHPATTGLGVAWRARKDLKVTCDVAQTWWKGYSSRLTYKDAGGLLNDKPNAYHWFNSVKVRLGVLKRLDKKTEVMAGYAFDTWAIDRKSVDFSTAIDVPMHRFSAAVTRTWSPVEVTLGALAGSGRRTSNGVDYSVRGWYVMNEIKYRF